MLNRVELARQEWADGQRRLEAEAQDARLYRRLLQQVELVADELRRRVGQRFTLEELAREYEDADRWARDAVAAVATAPDLPHLTTVEQAAFHSYSRGAVDYVP